MRGAIAIGGRGRSAERPYDGYGAAHHIRLCINNGRIRGEILVNLCLHEIDMTMTLFKDKYRIESARCPNWDYASNGYYFLTICTYNRECYFGDVIEGELYLSAIGDIVARELRKTPQLRSYVELDKWVIMPNHLHAILILQKEALTISRQFQQKGNATLAKKGLQSGSLGAIINQFKARCTCQIRQAGRDDFRWQPRFHDHIIRSDRALQNIREYIINNPRQWSSDEHHPSNIVAN